MDKHKQAKENRFYDKSDAQLIEMILFEKGKFNYAIIQEAKLEIERRNISAELRQKLKKEIKRKRRRAYLSGKRDGSSWYGAEIFFEFLLLFFR